MSFDELNSPLKIAEAHIAHAMDAFIRILGPESARILALSLIADYVPPPAMSGIGPAKFCETRH